MHTEARTFEITSSAQEVVRLVRWIEPILGRSNLSPSKAYQFQTALVELVNNAIEHAYQKAPGHPIHITLEQRDDGLVGVVKNKGAAFTAPSSPAQCELMAESGRGNRIIRSWVDEISYDQMDGWNICSLFSKRNA